MADVKISQLPAATTPVVGTEVLPIVQSGTTAQVSINAATGITRPFTANGVVYASSTSALATGSTFVFDGGNVGIGSTVATYGKLTIGNSQADGAQTPANSGILFYQTAPWAQAGIWPLGSAGYAGSLLFGTNSSGAVNTVTERMRIDSSGNVGIGTSSPSTYGKFVVAGGDGNTQFNVGTNGILRIAGYSSTYSGALLESVNTTQSGYLPITINGSYTVLATGGTERMRIDSSGRVIIGTTTAITSSLQTLQFDSGTLNTAITATSYGVNPSISLRAAGGTAASPSATVNNPINIIGGTTSDGTTFFNTISISGIIESTPSAGSHPTAITFSTTPSGSTSRSERMRIDSSGNVGIGTSSPSASAILDAQSTTKGVRMPNMTTTQKNAISSPAAGLIVFDTTLAKLCVYSGSAWQTITSV